jgi:hypothetical protein
MTKDRMNANPILERLAAIVVLTGLSFTLGAVSVSVVEGVELKFRPASGIEPVVGHYLVTLDATVAADAAEVSAESLVHSYGGQREMYTCSDVRTFRGDDAAVQGALAQRGSTRAAGRGDATG